MTTTPSSYWNRVASSSDGRLLGDRVDGVLEDLALAACHAGRVSHLDDSLTTVECSLIDDRAQEGVTLPGLMPTPRKPLTRREREVLRLAAEGFPTRDIAGHLAVSHKTVQSHLKNAMKKMRPDPPDGGGAEVREPRRTPPSPGSASASADEPSG